MTKESVGKILKAVEESLEVLHAISKISKKEFISSREYQDRAQWNFYVVIQGCLDLGNHLISIKRFGMPERYEDIISILEKEKVITTKIASALRGIGGFRNLIAHGYFKTDLGLLYSYLKRLDDIKKFIKIIGPHLK